MVPKALNNIILALSYLSGGRETPESPKNITYPKTITYLEF